jgi:hypothetical protein
MIAYRVGSTGDTAQIILTPARGDTDHRQYVKERVLTTPGTEQDSAKAEHGDEAAVALSGHALSSLSASVPLSGIERHDP